MTLFEMPSKSKSTKCATNRIVLVAIVASIAYAVFYVLRKHKPLRAPVAIDNGHAPDVVNTPPESVDVDPSVDTTIKRRDQGASIWGNADQLA